MEMIEVNFPKKHRRGFYIEDSLRELRNRNVKITAPDNFIDEFKKLISDSLGVAVKNKKGIVEHSKGDDVIDGEFEVRK